MAYVHDYLATEITLDREPAEGDRHRARLMVCANSDNTAEAFLFLKMLGLM